MNHETDARRLLTLTAACAALFLISSAAAYAQRGYLAVGGEYAFVVAPVMAFLAWALGGGDGRAE